MNNGTQNIIDSLPGGFDYNWTQTWPGDDGQTYETNGDTGMDIPNPHARSQAMKYYDGVQDAIASCEQNEQAAREYLSAGDLNAALESIEDAARKEREYGDDPTYSPIVEALEALLGIND